MDGNHQHITRNKLPFIPQYSISLDRNVWRNYWNSLKHSPCEERDIDEIRQAELISLLSIKSDVKQGIYPFKGIKLSRADIKWLLEAHWKQQEFIETSNESQKKFIGKGLDLRGAELCRVNLRGLSLKGLYGGLIWEDWRDATPEQREIAAIHLEGANLYETHLEEAILNSAYLEGAYLSKVYLTGAELNGAFLEGVDCWRAHFEDAYLANAHLEAANLYKACLERAYLYEAHLEGTQFYETHLEGCDLTRASLEGKSILPEDFERIYEWSQNVPKTLPPADLRRAYFDTSTNLEGINLGTGEYGSVVLVDALLNNVNLAVVNWSKVKMLGDEYQARKTTTIEGEKKDATIQLEEYENAVRANRQLAVALQSQGMNEDAARFAYRAQKLQRTVLWLERKFGQYLFSGFLDLLAGYGYRPGRSVAWYLIIIFGFALAYHFLGSLSLYPPDAVIFSVMSFHGRGFFPSLSSETNLHNPLVMLAALEAIVGLLIEISFIATFTQRFFGK